MERIFKYGKMDRRARRITAISAGVLALAGIFCLVWCIGDGEGYAVAWYVLLAIAVVALFVLSVPRSIEVSGSAIEIKCLVEATYIPLSDLRGIRRVEPGELRGTVCLAGSPGIFGYFGIYLDTKRMEFVKMYCTEWDNFVEITDIFEKRYYVSCPRAGELIALVGEAVRPLSE